MKTKTKQPEMTIKNKKAIYLVTIYFKIIIYATDLQVNNVHDQKLEMYVLIFWVSCI